MSCLVVFYFYIVLLFMSFLLLFDQLYIKTDKFLIFDVLILSFMKLLQVDQTVLAALWNI